MAAKTHTAVRLPDDLLEQIDTLAERMRREQPGLDVSRATVIRILITKGLLALKHEHRVRKGDK